MNDKPPGKPPEPPKKPPTPKPETKAFTAETASPDGANATVGCRRLNSMDSVGATESLDSDDSTGPGTVYCINRPGRPCPGSCDED
jgi:hypothetical protein